MRGRLALAAVAILTICGMVRGENFDRLSEADRAAFAERFEKEIWPVLSRGGKESCIGCHAVGKGNVTTLRFTGDARKDYAKILKEGYLIPNDAGSVLERIKTTRPDRKMPPGKRDRVPDEDIRVLERFINDVEAKQAKK
jgi:hypothetical protein